jgi:hypothetical protein
MPSRLLVVSLTVGLLSGCALPDLRELGCGDSVLGEGEDCDGRYVMAGAACGAVGTPNECRYVCAGTAPCPEGWGCGSDARCYQPQPAFAGLSLREPLPGAISAVSDADGDGLGDLVGSDGITLSAGFGDGDAAFSSRFDLSVPNQSGAVSFAPFDFDVPTDILVPLQRALLIFTGGDTREYMSRLIPGSRQIVLAAAGAVVEADGDITSEILLLTETEVGSSMRFREATGCDPFPLPDGQRVSRLVTTRVLDPSAGRIARADLDGDGITELALGFRGSSKLYLYTSAGAEDGQDPATCLRPVPYAPQPEIALPDGYALADTQVLFADVSGDGKLDVLVGLSEVFPVELPYYPLVALWVAEGTGDGALTFLPFTERVEFQPLLQDDAASGPLAAGDLDGDGIADYVMPTGIFLTEPSASPRLTPIAVPRTSLWSDAVMVDLNADGFLDVVAISEQARGVDWFLNAGPAGLPGQLNLFVVDTALPVWSLATGDFNGDFAIDVALVEVSAPSEPGALTVVFSIGAGLPGEAQPNASLGALTWFMEAALLPDLSSAGGSQIDGIDDLVLLDSPEYPVGGEVVSQEVKLYELLGSAAQKLLAPIYVFDPADEIDGPRVAVVAAAGRFVSGAGADAASPQRDVAVLSIAKDALSFDGASDTSLALLAGTSAGDLRRELVSQEIADQLSGYDPRCMAWLAGDVDDAGEGPGVDELIAVERTRCDSRAGTGEPLSVLVMRLSAPAVQRIQRLDLPLAYESVLGEQLVDLDLDGKQDLVLVGAFPGDGGEQPGSTGPTAEVRILWNDATCATPPFCVESSTILPAEDLRENDAEPWLSLVDVVAVQVHGDGRRELAVLYRRDTALMSARAAVLAFTSSADSPRAYRRLGTEPIIDLRDRVISQVIAGDVNGDGLDDLALPEVTTTRVFLQTPAEPIGTALTQSSTLPEELP